VYATLPAFVLGFHGCDRAVAEVVLSGKQPLKPSENNYDWLGHGIYFWENNPGRAMDYAQRLKATPKRTRGVVLDPFVIGAVVDLGHCLNLLESKSLSLLKSAYELLNQAATTSGVKLPKNKRVQGEVLIRHLDCAVIEAVHEVNENEGGRPYDSVLGVFMEGQPLYDGTEFRERNHIQICVRNPNCIKGFFRVRESDKNFAIP
jgi:hypothetical protein